MNGLIDLFAGPGGWDVAAHALGLEPLGVEWDGAACDTRRAAGLPTLQADVAELDPRAVAGPGPVGLLIASPPCQTFSMAGGGEGRALAPELAAVALARLGFNSEDAEVAMATVGEADPRSLLVTEPARWIADLEPETVCMEQVPSVLPIWEAYADGLRRLGYSAWTGVLSAERYGVPQTRRRAILIASRVRDVGEPPATHQRYISPTKDRTDMDTLFGDDTPERGRIVHPADRDLLPWVSMAEALGWTDGPSPSPAPTVHFGHALNSVTWVPAEYNSRDQRDGRTGAPHRRRQVEEPAPTIAAESRNDSWCGDRPATTVACDPRIQPPGHKLNADDLAAGRDDYDGRAGTNAVRVTVEQAAALQSFPDGYPWQGSRTKQFEQVGNAVPPLLALAVLSAALPTTQGTHEHHH